MAGRNAAISVSIVGDADFGAARREAKDALDKIEKEARDITLSPELDSGPIREALALADKLDGLTAQMAIDADLSQVLEAEKIAKSLRGFQARVDLSVEGREELKDALGLADKMEGIRRLKVELQGQEDLKRALEIADDLENRRTVQIDVDDSQLLKAGDKLESSLDAAGESGADSIAGHLADIDFDGIGASGLDQLTGAIGAAGPWGAVAASIGVLLADDISEAFSDHFGSKRAGVLRALRTGLTPAELEEVGRTAGEIYTGGLADELTRGEIADAAATISDQLGDIGKDFDLTEVTRQAIALEQVFGTDLSASIAAVDKLLSLKLVPSAEAGFNALFELGQQVGDIKFDEAVEVATEFGTALAALGIDGPQGLHLIGEAIRLDIFPQIDQAGEVFEEFNETIRTGGAADALELIGLKASDMQDMLARGDGAEAMDLIAEKLLALPDPAQRAAAAAEIYGGNMALVADPDVALELFAQADGWRAIGTGASDAADQTEDARANLDAFQKGVGAGFSDFLDDVDSGLGFVSEGLVGFIDKMTGGTSSAEALTRAVGEGPPKMSEMADASGELAGKLDGAAQSADELEAQLRGLFDFSADQLMRDIAGAADDLADSLADGGLKALDMSGGIDISTESGRRLQEQMEGLNEILIDANVAAANNDITSEQLAGTQTFLAGEFDRVAAAAGLTKEQAEALRQKYLEMPAEVSTTLNANTATAIANVTALQRAINNINSKNVTISASTGTNLLGSGTSVKLKARGGWTDGLTLVGEEGPELIDVRGRAFVHTAAETRELMSNRGGALGGGPAVPGRTGPAINIEQLVVDKGVDVWQQLQLAELVYGGGRR